MWINAKYEHYEKKKVSSVFRPFQKANVSFPTPTETVTQVVHIPRISAGFSMRLSQRELARRKSFMELKRFQQVSFFQ